jgi:maltose/moltooligosaccharide transporter
MMAGAGVAWVSILSIPFAMLNDHVTQGDERAMMGVFNLFVCMPQFITALTVGQWIEQSPVQTAFGLSHNWSLAFIFASAMVAMAILVLQTVKEKRI